MLCSQTNLERRAVAEALLIGSLKVEKGGEQLFEGEGGSGGT